MEEWRDIKDYEGIYKISNLGRIKSLKYNKERILKLGSNPLGYAIIGLWKDKQQKFYPVHRIVAKTFIDNPEDKQEVNHIDGNKRNNNIKNLEWVTHSENMKHAIKNHLLIRIGNNRKIQKIEQLDLNGNVIKIWNSCNDITKELGIYDSHIYSCCNYKRKTAYGYKWRYKNELAVSKTN